MCTFVDRILPHVLHGIKIFTLPSFIHRDDGFPFEHPPSEVAENISNSIEMKIQSVYFLSITKMGNFSRYSMGGFVRGRTVYVKCGAQGLFTPAFRITINFFHSLIRNCVMAI